MISLVLIEPKTPGNIGAIARIMANFNFKDLVIINPRCNHLAEESLWRAKRAKPILKKAGILSSFKELERYDYLIGTTGNLGSSYNIPRCPLSPEQLAEKINKINKSKIALILGREGDGLTNNEVNQCDFTVTIQSSPKYSSLNISHAVAILLYEIFKVSKKKKIGQHIIPLPSKEKDHLLRMINETLEKLPFTSEHRRITQRATWKRIVGKSLLTRREGYTLMGFFDKVRKHITSKDKKQKNS